MTPERRREVMTVFQAALERGPGDRGAFLDRACGSDAALRQEVDSLLAADAEASGFLDTPATAVAARRAAVAGTDLGRATGAGAPHSAGDSDLAARLQAALGSAYRVERELGGGGMSRVFVAEETALGRRVVVKVLPPELGAAIDRERFHREVRLAASLRHPHIVPLLAAGESPDGLVYYTMPFIQGASLRQRLDREGGLPITEAICILREVADALAYAHRHGIAHRDVKPANVLVEEGHALLTDLGIAKALSATTDGAAGGTALTSAGLIVGTPGYMAPEQVTGDPAADHRVDLYALGCLAYEVLTGGPPFPGRTRHEVAAAHLAQAPEPVAGRNPAVPPALAALVMRLLEKRPAERPQTANEVLRELDLVTTPVAAPGQALPPAPAGARAATRAATPRRQLVRVRNVLFAVTAVTAAAAAGWFTWETVRTPVATPAGPPKLVVLPFENLGRPDDEYFADGITEEITSRLARVSGLGVIARTSAAQYKGTGKPVRQIGRELGVGYVLEGTVRWDKTHAGGSRVRVNPQLVRVSDETQLWAEPYEGKLADVFEVQTAVAEQVAGALDVTLLAPERRAMAARPTRNLDAYDAYLRGNALTTRPMSFVPQARREAVRMYERAVALDSGFAPAWARLALAHGRLYVGGDDPTASRLARARAAASRAFSLDSTLPEASLALGELADDRRRAIERYAIALRGHPNDVELLYAIGSEQRKLERYEEALTSFTHAAALDPRSPDGPAEIANLHDVRGEYAAAVRVREREIALTPDNAVAYVAQALSYVNWSGDTAAARRTIQRGVDAVGRARVVQVLTTRSGVRVSRVLWPTLDAATRQALDTLTLRAAQSAPWNVYRLKAEHFERSRRPERARAYHDSARIVLAAQLRRQPDDPGLHSSLALAYAALGRAAYAVREARRGIELARAPQYAADRLTFSFALAMVYARMGEDEAAVEQLEAGLPTSPSVSPHWLRLDPTWGRLRGNPRFQRLLIRKQAHSEP